ncbi:MAG TPA: hypothetical protein VE986_08665 [Hyphomicrobiales bacterium]|nr:hypothetical protein [Hyphomicrobiales bacterium]
MTAGITGPFILAMDVTGLEDFATIGFLRQPSAALSLAASRLRQLKPDSEGFGNCIRLLAKNVSGLCVFQNRRTQLLAETIFSLNLAMEWRITVPQTGVLQAVFLVKSLIGLEADGRLFELALQLAGKATLQGLKAESVAVLQK